MANPSLSRFGFLCASLVTNRLYRHCALLEVQDKAFEITPIPLRTVRPFKMDTVYLTTIAEEEDINLNDRLSINSFLKRRINDLIRDAKQEFQERNADADEPVPPMLPLIRLRVTLSHLCNGTSDLLLGRHDWRPGNDKPSTTRT
jgi:double-strand break repair protein MRE11